jgi:hypothetical protein
MVQRNSLHAPNFAALVCFSSASGNSWGDWLLRHPQPGG